MGKHILTVEGLTEAEQETFVYAFGAVGAVQCGFCIPGMVLSGKALLDQNPDPSEDEIKKAIRGNVCRCTGYKKIIEGISPGRGHPAGRRPWTPPWAGEDASGWGAGLPAPMCGTRCWARGVLRRCGPSRAWSTPQPSAQVPPGTCAGHRRLGRPGPPRRAGGAYRRGCASQQGGAIQQDWDVMIARGDITRCVGDAICLVVAETRTSLAKPKSW